MLIHLQLKLFLNEVSEQTLLPSIRSYLKLYTTISISKLASYMEMPEAELRTHLMALKHKTRQMIWQVTALPRCGFESRPSAC